MDAKIDLEELERLAALATPVPWSQRGNFIFCAQNKRLAYVEAERALDLQTAAYIVAACNAVPELVARVRELEYQLGEVEFDNSGLCREIDALKRQKDWLAARFSGEHDGVPASEYFLQLAEEATKEAGSNGF